MKRLLVLLFNAIALLGFAAAADTIPPLRPPRPPQNTHLAPHVHLGRSEQMTLTNLVVFIRFADEEEFSETLAPIAQMFNDTAYQQISVNNYFHSMTYGKINYHTVFTNNIQDTAIISYQDAHPHAYYQPRSSSNPEGYSGMGPALLRRNVMLANAMAYVDSLHLVDSTINLDGNNDGLIDNISFILKCDIDNWDDLLWPQMDFFDTTSFDVNINGKTPCAFNLEFAHSGDYFTANTFCHEMGHSLGLPDLYHYYNYPYIEPVFFWDIMGQNNLQQVSAILKYKFLGVIDEPIEITESGHYVLNSVTSSDQNNCYFIRSSINPSQWYTIEYRNSDDFMENVPHSGVIIGRWNDNVNPNDLDHSGNAYFNNSTVPHSYWVFRPNSSNDITNGNINNAAFGNNNRTSFGPTTNPHPYLTNGTPETSFEITNIQYFGDQASFDVEFLNDGIVSHESNSVCIFPNPTDGIVNISNAAFTEVQLFDAYGKLLGSWPTESETMKLDLSCHATGIYFVKILNHNGTMGVEKVVKR